MRKIKSLSFDMYRTLIDTRDFHEQSVREILEQNSATLVNLNDFHSRWDEIYDEIYLALSEDEFMSLYEVSIESLCRTMREFGVKGDPKAGADLWLSKYENAGLFPEVEEVLHILAKKYPIVITSNVDNNDLGYAMLRKKNLPIEAVITSESSRSYKPQEKIFKDALSILGCRPEEVLHIGDSQRADVLGAKKFGMIAVWVKRRPSDKLKQGIPKPDYEITDLRELLEIITLTSR